jgi:hypothetical protein
LGAPITNAGEVVSAIIRTSSGDQKFDASVVQAEALYRASPLPLPRNPSVFEPNITLWLSENPQNCQLKVQPAFFTGRPAGTSETVY